MNKYYTLMLIPEKEKEVKSIRIPGIFFRSLAFIFVLSTILVGILAFDYYKIQQQVYEIKHLNLVNKQLREQIQLFQMKINTLTSDIKRIHTFEKKLRVITGLDTTSKQKPVIESSATPMHGDDSEDAEDQNSTYNNTKKKNYFESRVDSKLNFRNMTESADYINLKNLYDKKIAMNLGMESNYGLTKQWSELSKRSFALAGYYARFDYQYNKIKNVFSEIELDIHELDQFLLDKDSFLLSTPTILPTNGWITSYFGQRYSPHSGILKMHEGIDVGAPYGTTIVAPADGIITFAGVKAGFGKFVQIDHGYGVETLFAHSQSIHVKNGQKIKRGSLIAKIGSTGASTGPHLHYEVRVNGIAVDPLYYVLQ
ncbi:MAG: murein DD-endopeptidase MepM/ murein hydrolase activator NlpD [Arenicella sp.]|jgi:murein DD-endopeptidase MepM/ murein hydrolase activator NlpD